MHISAHNIAPVAAGHLDAAKLGLEDVHRPLAAADRPRPDVIVERLRINSQHVGYLLHGQGSGRYRARCRDNAFTADTRWSATGTRCDAIAVKPGYVDLRCPRA